MNLTRRNFLKLGAVTALAAAVPRAFAKVVARPRLDPNLVLLFSDSHVNGHFDAYRQDERESLTDTLARILQLDPLPAYAVHFGDTSYLWGHKEDYELVRRLLKPLEDLGVRLTIGMGNHDRRSAFLEVFPEYAATTKIPGRIVSVADAGAVDFIMLDGLVGADERAGDDGGPGGGKLCRDQQDWLMAALPEWKKPVFVCSHWAAAGLNVGDRKLHEFLIDCPMTTGYIHGHHHRWRKDFAHRSWTSPKILKTLCLPATGHWGDIGFALMRIDGDTATVSLHQHDFYFPGPAPQEPGENREMWRYNTVENKGATCTFTLPRI